MNTSGRLLIPSIEILESRIAPAALTFTDSDGDRVRILSSNGSADDLSAAAHRRKARLRSLLDDM